MVLGGSGSVQSTENIVDPPVMTFEEKVQFQVDHTLGCFPEDECSRKLEDRLRAMCIEHVLSLEAKPDYARIESHLASEMKGSKPDLAALNCSEINRDLFKCLKKYELLGTPFECP